MKPIESELQMRTAQCRWLLTPILLFLCGNVAAQDAKPLKEIAIKSPANWRKERFSLPPSFAPDMHFKGMEELRFAPGMFRPDAENFFTYVLVFRLTEKPTVSRDVLETELLAYYRGLAKAVGGGKIPTQEFSLKLKAAEKLAPTNAQDYRAILTWTEPFRTKKEQTLNLAIRVWKTTPGQHTWLFVEASPQPENAPLWKTLNTIRDQFFQAHLPSGSGF